MLSRKSDYAGLPVPFIRVCEISAAIGHLSRLGRRAGERRPPIFLGRRVLAAQPRRAMTRRSVGRWLRLLGAAMAAGLTRCRQVKCASDFAGSSPPHGELPMSAAPALYVLGVGQQLIGERMALLIAADRRHEVLFLPSPMRPAGVRCLSLK